MHEIKRYADVGLHRRMCEIIRRHSENKQDIREIASQLIEWQNVKRILDLGCGYGWFEEAIDGSFDLIIGIDPFEENRDEFLKVCSRISKEVCFKKAILPILIDRPEGHFDLILSIYSLYFFPDMIGEVKRLLNKGGVFLTITHSESMLEEGERYFSFKNLRQIIRRFSAENGEEILKRVFSRVSYVDYPNNLVFFEKDREDLRSYIDFKRDFIMKDADADVVAKRMVDELELIGSLRFNKNDRIFLAKP